MSGAPNRSSTSLLAAVGARDHDGALRRALPRSSCCICRASLRSVARACLVLLVRTHGRDDACRAKVGVSHTHACK